MKKRALLFLVLLADCKCGKKPDPPPLEHVTNLVVEDATIKGDAPMFTAPAHGRPWIRLTGPAFVTETPMHGGPDWSFETDLPAIDQDGNVALPFDATHDLSDLPNLAVRFVGPDDRILSTLPVLDVADFANALEAPAKASAFGALAPKVQKRVDAANTELDAKGYVQIAACTIDELPYAEHPPCSMAKQTLHCGNATITYSAQTLSVAGATKLSMPAWKRPPMKTAYGPVEVRECFAAAFADLARKVFVGELDYECQAGGDWCTIEPEWRIVRW